MCLTPESQQISTITTTASSEFLTLVLWFHLANWPSKITCLWLAWNVCLFYLLVSHSFTMLSREPEISWCSWVGDHFTDVTQPVWEVRDRRTKEPSGQERGEKKKSYSQPMATVTGPFKMHAKFSQQHICVWGVCPHYSAIVISEIKVNKKKSHTSSGKRN